MHHTRFLLCHDSHHRKILAAVNSMLSGYHNTAMIHLESQLAEQEGAEYLKRYYEEFEWEGKITMLS